MQWDYSIDNLRTFVDTLSGLEKENLEVRQAEEGGAVTPTEGNDGGDQKEGADEPKVDVRTNVLEAVAQLCLESSVRPPATETYLVPTLAKEISDWACLLPLVVEETCDDLETTVDNVLITDNMTHFHENDEETPLVKQAMRPSGKSQLVKNMSLELSEAVQRFADAAVTSEDATIQEDGEYRQNDWAKKMTLDTLITENAGLSGKTMFLHCDLDVSGAMKRQDPVKLAELLSEQAAALEELKNKPPEPVVVADKDGSDDDDDDDDDEDDDDDDDDDKKEILPPFEFYLDSSFSKSNHPDLKKVEDTVVAILSTMRAGASVVLVGSTLGACTYEEVAAPREGESKEAGAQVVEAELLSGQPSLEAVTKVLADTLESKCSDMLLNPADLNVTFCKSLFEVEEMLNEVTSTTTRVFVLEHLGDVDGLLAPISAPEPVVVSEDGAEDKAEPSATEDVKDGVDDSEVAAVDAAPRTRTALLEKMSTLCGGMVCDSLEETVVSEGIATKFQTELKVMGPLLEKEARLLSFSPGFERAGRPVLGIVGGGSLDTAALRNKLRIIDNLLENVDELVLGGLLGFTFLKAKGINIGKTVVDEAVLPLAQMLLKKATRRCVKLILPVDCILGDLQLNEPRPKNPDDSDDEDDDEDDPDDDDVDGEEDDDDEESGKGKVVDKTIPFFGETQEYTFDKMWSGLRDLKKVQLSSGVWMSPRQ
jgi:3-phosphoglycerate kinase